VGRRDGALWFTEQNANKLARITTGGEVTEYDLAPLLSAPAGIAPGPGISGLWVVGLNGNGIGGATACRPGSRDDLY
jgi:virginiamycin B lyase